MSGVTDSTVTGLRIGAISGVAAVEAAQLTLDLLQRAAAEVAYRLRSVSRGHGVVPDHDPIMLACPRGRRKSRSRRATMGGETAEDRHGERMNKIKSGFFAVAEVDDPEGHAEYNWFHSSDHIPENLALDGVILAARWAAPQRYMDARLAVHPSFATSQYLIHYLMTEPLEEAFQQFAELSGRTRSLGRYFEPRTIHASGHYNLLKAYVAPRLPISPEAVPFRPHRGVFVVMKDLLDLSKRQELAQWHDQVHVPDVLTVKGVTGCYWFESWTRERAPSSGPGHPEQRWVFLYYLDEDPLEMMADLPKKQAEWRAAGRAYDASQSMEVVLAGPYQTIDDPERYDWRAK